MAKNNGDKAVKKMITIPGELHFKITLENVMQNYERDDKISAEAEILLLISEGLTAREKRVKKKEAKQ